MTSATVSDARLGIGRSGIAAAAQVQRPVVTMWMARPRSAGQVVPFPAPVTRDPELFDLDDILAWQARTGRGNNPEFADDAPSYTVSLGSVDARASSTSHPDVSDAFTALVALGALSGETLTGLRTEEILGLACALDPDDRCLVGELAVAGDGIVDLAALADRKVDAAYGHGPAMDRLVSAGQVTAGAGRSWTPTPQLVTLIRALVEGLAGGRADDVVVEDPTQAPGDLALRVALADPDGGSTWVAPTADTPAPMATRLLRRRAIAGAIRIGEPRDAARAIQVVQLPHRGTGPMSELAVLTAADDLQLGLSAGRHAVLLGPASALCDRLNDQDAGAARDGILRSARLRTVIRLPLGLLVDRPRAELGLWVFGDAPEGVAIGDRVVVTADASAGPLTPVTIDALVSDTLASLGGPAQLRARAFAFGRIATVARLVARDEVLVDRLPRSTARHRGSEAVVLARRALDRLRVPDPAPRVAIGLPNDAVRGSHASLGALVEAGRARVLRGTKIDPADVARDGSVRVLRPEGVEAGRATGIHLDALTAATRYRRAQRTRPGDLVVTTRPRPRAVVDDAGGSLVVAPARIVRLPDGAAPHAAAAAINALPPTAQRWQAWVLPLPDPAVVPGLEAALAELEDLRDRAAARLASIDDLTRHIVAGATAGALIPHTNPQAPAADGRVTPDPEGEADPHAAEDQG